MNARVVVPSLVIAAVLGAAACSSKKPPEPQHPIVVDLVDAGGGDAAAADGGMLATAADRGAADAGVPLAADAVADLAIDTAIATSAAKNAPGMAPEGTAGRATLAAGGHFEMIVTLQPNRCYTFVGFSPPGAVQQLDLKLFMPPLYTIESGKAVNEKNSPVMGKGKNHICPALPVALPYKLDIAATKGAGRVGVLVYSKAK